MAALGRKTDKLCFTKKTCKPLSSFITFNFIISHDAIIVNTFLHNKKKNFISGLMSNKKNRVKVPVWESLRFSFLYSSFDFSDLSIHLTIWAYDNLVIKEKILFHSSLVQVILYFNFVCFCFVSYTV